MSKNNRSQNENPFFSHGLRFAGFCHNLQLGEPEACGALFSKAYEPNRLAAIKQQADNIHDAAVDGMKTIGALLALAAAAGDLPETTVSNAGWMIEFLAEVACDTSVFAENARFALEHGSMLKG